MEKIYDIQHNSETAFEKDKRVRNECRDEGMRRKFLKETEWKRQR